MRSNKAILKWSVLIALVGATVFTMFASTAAAQEKVLYSFNSDGVYGISPYSSLIFDAAGNLYGTTLAGGSLTCSADSHGGCGTVFELSPNGRGGWSEKVLYAFPSSGLNGAGPTAGLVFDASGNLYGTTSAGGPGLNGTVFQLAPQTDGSWTEKILHSFDNNGKDGSSPVTPLTIDGSGNLYGTTRNGGAYSSGTVFELKPSTGGSWIEKVLHSFGSGTDGASEEGGLILDHAGNLYGTTFYGGAYSLGTVFELSPTAGGWTESVLHNFGNGTDARYPWTSLIFDASGNLYGATLGGGGLGDGTVFELSPGAGGEWTEAILFNFIPKETGSQPGGIIMDAAGNLYGTTAFGAQYNAGTVFRLTRTLKGGWTGNLLHTFGSGTDASGPLAAPVFDSTGHMYGTTGGGGAYGYGAVYEITL
jgi:uncharacterized repeat protein (TIGR03803 family)